jgi:DNA primase
MARVPEAEIERLKREIALERLVAAKGVKLVKRGDDLVGLCPFHDDRTPSLVVSPEKNLWHCLGACQAGGSVIDWVMRAEGGISFRHAVELLRGGPVDAAPAASRGTRRKLDPIAERDVEDDALLERVVDFYASTLHESPEALGYLEKRGIGNEEAIRTFRLGYANRTLGYRLPERNRRAGAELRGRLERLGVYRASGHEHLAGSIVVPLFDEGGRVVQLYGRKVLDNLRPGTPMHLYLPGPQRGVWNRAALASGDEMILCESLIDALTFWCAGLRNVTTAYGVEGYTDELHEALVAAGIRTVRIAFDRDEAGDRGAAKVSERLAAAGITTYRVVFPHGLDANAYALKLQPAAKSLELAVRNARWMAGTERIAIPGAATAATTPASDDVAEPLEHDDVAEERSGPETAAEGGSLPSFAAELPAPPAASREAVAMLTPERPPAPSAPTGGGIPLRGVEQGEDLVFTVGDRRWRVRGLGGNASAGELRVQLFVARDAAARFFVDQVELYAARQRAAFVKQAATELEVDEAVLRRDLGPILLELEARRDAALAEALAPKTASPVMTDDEEREALALLRDPRLVERIARDLDAVGIVGERDNKLLGYLAATSRKLSAPLAIVIQSSSAAGKTSLMDAVLGLMPEEERVQYSAMTGQSLYYLGEQGLSHKILAVVEEEGAERASYALKLLQSEGELVIASTGKEPSTGKLVTHTYRVEGPVMIFLTTTAMEVDEELLNRCLVLTVDEGRAQTRAIHAEQRAAQTLDGMVAREERRRVRRVHRNAQRLLRPLSVVNPFAQDLRFVDHAPRTRRDHMKYLVLIQAIALLHQHQRPVKSIEKGGQRIEYVEVARGDIDLAARLLETVIGRSLDELAPQTRRLLEEIRAYVLEVAARDGRKPDEIGFTRREVRDRGGWGDTQLKVHLGRLEELEYVVAFRPRGGGRTLYELLWSGEGEAGERFVLGLGGADAAVESRAAPATTATTPPARLARKPPATGAIDGYDAERSAPARPWSDPGRPPVGPWSAGGRAPERARIAANGSRSALDAASDAKTHIWKPS